jgi:acyl-ACP thioesterase
MNKYSKTYNVIIDNMDLNHYRLRPIAAIMYLQDAFARYCATRRMAAYDLFATNQYWVVTEFNMEFLDELPFWSEDITAEVWISEISKLKIYMDFRVYYNDKVFTQGNSLWFIIDKESKRPAKTDIVAEKFEINPELALGEHTKFTLPEKTEKYNEIVHKNNLSDLDFNNHVNNKSYINLAEMSAPDEYKKTHKLKRLNIKFNRETFIGDVLTCSTYKTNMPNVYTHIIEKDGASVCDISTEWEENKNNDFICEYPLKVKSEK